MRSRHRRTLVFALLVAGACGTGGTLISEDQLAEIRPGVSTKPEVRAVLGEPKAVSPSESSGSGSETWIYGLATYASDPYTGVPPVGVDSFPITRAQRTTTEVRIRFDGDDVVSAITERRPRYE